MSTPFTPLEGIRVLDLSRYLPGPFLTRVLCDLGAEIIKVEPPMGDALRYVPPAIDGMGAAYGSVNAGKKSIALDLRKDEGKALLHAMVERVDVLVESFRPGVLARFGLDDANLERLNPRLIAISISGYGQSGPLASRAGHDLNYLARAGVLATTGPADRPPGVPGVQIADVAGGSLPAAIAVLGALIERDKTGRGRRLDLSITRSVLAMGVIAQANAAAGQVEERGDGYLTGGLPSYRCYRTSDGRYLSVGALEPHFFQTFCELIGRPDLATSGLAVGEESRSAALQIAGVLAKKPLDHWLAVFDGHDVCVEPVLSLDEARTEQSAAVAEVDGHTVIKLDLGAPTRDPGPPSELGADAEAVCAMLEVPEEVVEAAREAGAFRS